MELIPKSREAAVLVADAAGDENLTPAQIAAFRYLYRLDSDETVASLVLSEELSLFALEDIQALIADIRQHGIHGKRQLHQRAADLKMVTDADQIALLRVELPDIIFNKYYLRHLLSVLDDMERPCMRPRHTIYGPWQMES